MRDVVGAASNEKPAMADRAASIRDVRPTLLAERELEAVSAAGSKPGTSGGQIKVGGGSP
jgi:hypothetical protein